MTTEKENLSPAVRSGDDQNGDTGEPLIQNQSLVSSTSPKDRFLGTFFILLLHGCAVLAPWNMFITICYPYFIDYKLSGDYVNATGEWNGPKAHELSLWRSSFCHRMTVANQVPNMLFTLVNCFIHFGENTLGTRIVCSLLVVVASFVVTVLMAAIDTSDYVYPFIYVSLVVVVIMMAAIGVYQNCVWGLAGPLPMHYANAIILGNNFVGILIVVFSIITQVTSPDMKVAAIYYFMMGIFLLLAAFDTYFALPLLKFYRYYLRLKQQHHEQTEHPTFVQTLTTFGSLFRKLWVHYWNVFAVFFVTLFVFPNVAMWIQPGKDEDFFIAGSMYNQILCFLTFNVFAFLGNLIPNFIQRPGPRFLWIFSTSRFLFIPFFLLLNFQPPDRYRRFPVLIESSWIFWAAMVLFSLSHGHGSSLAMMYAPKQAEERHASKAAMLAGVFLVFGVNFGIIASAIVDPIMLKAA